MFHCNSSKIAATHFKKRIASGEPKVIYLTLEVIDQAMQKCGNNMHVQIGSKDFMNVIVVMLTS